MPRQMFNILIQYPAEQEVFADQVRKFLRTALMGAVDRYIGFTNVIHGRYTFGPAIMGHLIVEHSATLTPQMLKQHLIDPENVLELKQIKRL